MSKKEKDICLHDFKLLSPPESSTSASSGFLSSSIVAIDNKPLLKCKKCKDIFVVDRDTNNLLKVKVDLNKDIVVTTKPSKTFNLRQKTNADESPYEYMERKGNELARFLKVLKNTRIFIRNEHYCGEEISFEVYLQNKSFFGYKIDSVSEYPLNATLLATFFCESEKKIKEQKFGNWTREGKKWIDEIRLYDKRYLDNIIVFGKKNKVKTIVDETKKVIDI